MNREKIQKLLEAISDVVEDGGPWTLKMDAVKSTASEDERWEPNLYEFASWFEPSH